MHKMQNRNKGKREREREREQLNSELRLLCSLPAREASAKGQRSSVQIGIDREDIGWTIREAGNHSDPAIVTCIDRLAMESAGCYGNTRTKITKKHAWIRALRCVTQGKGLKGRHESKRNTRGVLIECLPSLAVELS